MKENRLYYSDRAFYHIITLLICLTILVAAGISVLIDYTVQSSEEKHMCEAFTAAEEYNDIYFSGRILKGVTISGYDVGGMTSEEAHSYLETCVDYKINTEELVLNYGDSSWKLGKDKLMLTIDVDYAVDRALKLGRDGTDEERTEVFDKLNNGETIDISPTKISDPLPLMEELLSIKSQIDIQMKNASASFRYNGSPSYSYTDEVVGSSLDIYKAYENISQLLAKNTSTISYTLQPDVVKPKILRSDIEKEYTLVGKYTTNLSASAASGRIQNITVALSSLDERVWMPGETFSFNEWVGARSEERGYGLGVFINEQQQYDQVTGGGICQVSTTMYYCALLCGANMQGQNAPIEIIERRPHTWPSEYIDKGLDATVSWPSTDLKLFNNSQTPYFIHTYMEKKGVRLYVNIEIYGTPLPNNAKVRIETEIVEEIPATQETIVDTENKYALALGQEKIDKGHNGYTVNVYQIWSEPGKEDIKSLITVSRYNMISEKRYISAETKAAEDAAAAAAAAVAPDTTVPSA